MILINLLPAKVKQTKGAQRVTSYVILGASAAAILLVLGLLGIVLEIRQTETRLAQVDTAEAKLADKIAYLRSLTRDEHTSAKIRLLLAQLLPRQAVWITLLNNLAAFIRDDVWLTQVGAEPGKGGLTLDVEGESYTKIAVADFLTALEDSGVFTSVRLEALTDVKSGSLVVVRFNVKAQCKTLGQGVASLP